MKNYLVSMIFQSKTLATLRMFFGTQNNRLYIQQLKKQFTAGIPRKSQFGFGEKFIILDPQQKQRNIRHYKNK